MLLSLNILLKVLANKLDRNINSTRIENKYSLIIHRWNNCEYPTSNMSANRWSKFSKFSTVFECKLNVLKSTCNCNMQNQLFLYRKNQTVIKETQYKRIKLKDVKYLRIKNTRNLSIYCWVKLKMLANGET